MEYKGKLYGKVGNRSIPLEMTSDDVDELKAKASAYDRLMSGGRKTLKELASFLGMLVAVNRNGNVFWTEKNPRLSEDWGVWVVSNYRDAHGDIPKGVVDFNGDWQDSLTLPDGWEDTDGK